MGALPAVPRFFNIVALESIDSTSGEAKRLSGVGAAEGTLVWAVRQTAGHGRFGRAWISPPGNLYCSLLLRPARPAKEATQLTFVAALAVAEAIAGIVPPPARVSYKWPNDVLISGKKVAGILLESSLAADGNVESLVIGIGVNVAWHPHPDEVHHPATSLHAEGGVGACPRSVLERVCVAFLVWYDEWRERGFRSVREAWLARADRLHRRIEVRLGRETARGVFAGLDGNGALVLQQGDGQRLILAGDVFATDA